VNPLRRWVAQRLNRGLAPGRQIDLRVGWPLAILPLILLNQLLAPHAVWVTLLVALVGLYTLGYLWVRGQAPVVSLTRQRQGTILVAGDRLLEEIVLHNDGPIPVLWAEFMDQSTLPGYLAGRVVACEGNSFYRWRAEAVCAVRGIFRLGPHQLRMQDPFGLFSITIREAVEEAVIIYPRVVQLPTVPLPHGNVQGTEQRRRPLMGNLPAATVADYAPGVSLRNVHWVSTARRGRLMVKELELEPSGNVWVVLDLERRVQRGVGESDTLEQGVTLAASLAAKLLSGREQRAVGLMAYSGEGEAGGLLSVTPSVGGAHVWTLLAALAPVQAGDVGLAALLATVRSRIGRSGTLIVVTAAAAGNVAAGDEAESWLAELVHLKQQGVESSVVFVQTADEGEDAAQATVTQLARQDVPTTVVRAQERFPALLTFRRRRSVLRSTPTGGVVRYEIEEEVG
jgi:uncharacterized protein (DUF58 family)